MTDEIQGAGPAADAAATAEAPSTPTEGTTPAETEGTAPAIEPAPSSPVADTPPADTGAEPPADEPPAGEPEPAADTTEAEREQLQQAVADGEQPLVHGADQVAEQVAHDEEQGFHGQEVDDAPNSKYTLTGEAAGEPTPETPEGSDAQ